MYLEFHVLKNERELRYNVELEMYDTYKSKSLVFLLWLKFI